MSIDKRAYYRQTPLDPPPVQGPWFVRMLGWGLFTTPIIIIGVAMLAAMWGVGLHVIVQAFEWGWDFFGF